MQLYLKGEMMVAARGLGLTPGPFGSEMIAPYFMGASHEAHIGRDGHNPSDCNCGREGWSADEFV
jgi:hypothetical protein